MVGRSGRDQSRELILENGSFGSTGRIRLWTYVPMYLLQMVKRH